MKLIAKLAVSVAVGIVLGAFAPETLIRTLITFQGVFAECLTFIIPLFILFFIADGIASLDTHAGKLLGFTTGVAYLSTLGAGLLACLAGLSLLPHFNLVQPLELAKAALPAPFFSLSLPPIMGITSALIVAFIGGLGVAKTQAHHMRMFIKEGKLIVENLVYHGVIPALPFYIASLFAGMTVTGEVLQTIEIFGMVLLLAVSLHLIWLALLFVAAGAIAKVNPVKAFTTMLPAYLTALGTMSSVATLPVTMEQTLKNGVDEAVAEFTIPLCATMHMAGSTITITTAAIAVSLLSFGVTPTWTVLIPFVAMLGIMMIASPGVPGGSVMAALGILSSMLGFHEAALGLMITLYIAQDSFGTACNVAGDGAVALIVNKLIQSVQKRNRFHISITLPIEPSMTKSELEDTQDKLA